MAYEKKTEPLTRFDVFACGITLISWVVLLQILPWANSSITCDEEAIKLSVSSQKDVKIFHDCVKDNKQMYLFASTCLLLGYPIVLAQIHYLHKIFNTLWSCYNLDLFEVVYFGSWLIGATLYCIILPALVILFAYYDWEFADGYQYTGYAIQFQFAHFAIILSDCTCIPLGCTASASWFLFIYIILGFNNSSHWIISDVDRTKSVGRIFSCESCGTLLLLFVCMVMGCISLFGAFGKSFEYEKSGFFSYHGDSQWLYLVFFISWIIFSMVDLYVSCNLERYQESMNNIVKAVKPIPLSKKEIDKKEFDTNPVVPVGPIEVEPVIPASQEPQEDVIDADL